MGRVVERSQLDSSGDDGNMSRHASRGITENVFSNLPVWPLPRGYHRAACARAGDLSRGQEDPGDRRLEGDGRYSMEVPSL